MEYLHESAVTITVFNYLSAYSSVHAVPLDSQFIINECPKGFVIVQPAPLLHSQSEQEREDTGIFLMKIKHQQYVNSDVRN